MEIDCGPCAEFSIYHLMDLEPGEERFPKDDVATGYTNGTKNQSAPKVRISHSVSMIGRGAERQKPPTVVADSPILTPTDPVAVTPIENHRATPETLPSLKAFVNGGDHHHWKPAVLGDIARVRSKNAGPFEITYDAMFDSETVYYVVKKSGFLDTALACKAIGLDKESDVVWSGFFDPARAYKITAPRLRNGHRVASGSFMEGDVHASQKYIGLLNLPLPADLVESLAKIVR